MSDTIAAIATALSESGISIIRLSGPEAIAAGDCLYRTGKGKRALTSFAGNTIHYGYIVDKPEASAEEAGEEWREHILDEVMVSVMRAPHSYTAEDTVEINCHGGVLITRKILLAALEAGARLAEPGEFTKRAFLNGRIDLTRAEAVMDVIQSQSELALSASVRQLRGSVSDMVCRLRKEILYEIAFIESALDDPEHVSLEGYPHRLEIKVRDLKIRIGELISSFDSGRLMEEGIRTVIVGKPNVGKSSLMNLLVGEERAIVTEVAGTTRDVLTESIRLDGIGLQVVDTAGIHDTQDRVEKIGVEKARRWASDADLLLYVADGSAPLDENDRDILKLAGDKNTIILLNKMDLSCAVEEEEELLQALNAALGGGFTIEEESGSGGSVFQNTSGKEIPMIRISAVKNTGLQLLEEAVKRLFFRGVLRTDGELVITNMRHKEMLQEAYESLALVELSLDRQLPEDFYSIDLMNAYAYLGKIIGEDVGEDLVDEIFSRFCTGK